MYTTVVGYERCRGLPCASRWGDMKCRELGILSRLLPFGRFYIPEGVLVSSARCLLIVLDAGLVWLGPVDTTRVGKLF